MSAIIFNCDGLILDTDYGFDFGPLGKDLLIGRTLAAACDHAAEYFGRPGVGLQLEAELLPRVEAALQPMPGSGSLCDLVGDMVPMAVATNSPCAMLTAALRSSGFAEYVAVSIATDEAQLRTPNPHLHLDAFTLLRPEPKTVVALEDSATGVAAARAAGSFPSTVPSQPGKRLDGDYIAAALDDPALLAWVQDVTHRHRSTSCSVSSTIASKVA